MSINKKVLETACIETGIGKLNDEEHDFLVEYHDCLGIIAEALKILEGDNQSFGIFLPTLYGIRKELSAMHGQTRYCESLITAIENGFNERFKKMMNINDPISIPLYIAMVVDPQFKLNYMRMENVPPHIYDTVINILINEYNKNFSQTNEQEQEEEEEEEEQEQARASRTENEFDASISRSHRLLVPTDVSKSLRKHTKKLNTDLRDEICQYLDKRTTGSKNILKHLKKFPSIKKIYCKYNCLRTSEAICERMFSFAGKLIIFKCIFK